MHSVVCFQNFKLAAIYFDKILPIGGVELVSGDVFRSGNEEIPRELLPELTGFDGGWSDGPARPLLAFLSGISVSLSTVPGGHGLGALSSADYSAAASAYLTNYVDEDGYSYRERIADVASMLGLRSAGVLLPSMGNDDSRGAAASDLALILSGAPILDVSDVPWTQVSELRADSDSRRKLQRLRSFLLEKYVGKSLSFIEDDLSQRIDAHNRAAKKHGFDLRSGALATLLDARNIQTAAGLCLSVGYLAGIESGVAAAALLEVSKVTLEIGRRMHALKDWKDGHELAYLLEVKSSK
jgi:hypothetical protein